MERTYHAWTGAVVPHPFCFQESLLHLLLLLLAVVHGPASSSLCGDVCICACQFTWHGEGSITMRLSFRVHRVLSHFSICLFFPPSLP